MNSSPLPTDVLLLRLSGAQPSWQELRQRLAASATLRELGATPCRQAWSEASGQAYVYLDLPERIALSAQALRGIADLMESGAPLTVSRLSLMQALDGASHDQHAGTHYAVEMTPQAGWETELQHWYAREHLPGLARVPGCVRALRFWNHDQGPRSLACYDLVDEHVMGSQPWLEVRGTAWSSRVRPRSTETARTMFTLHDGD